MAIKFFAFFPTISTFGCFWSQWPTSLAVTERLPNNAVRAVAVAKRREYWSKWESAIVVPLVVSNGRISSANFAANKVDIGPYHG